MNLSDLRPDDRQYLVQVLHRCTNNADATLGRLAMQQAVTKVFDNYYFAGKQFGYLRYENIAWRQT